MITKKRARLLLKTRDRIVLLRAVRMFLRGTFAVVALLTGLPNVSALTFNLNYDPDSTFTSAGLSAADIVAMKAANTYAAAQFTNNFSDPIHINIKVTARAGTDTLGLAVMNLNKFSYSSILTKLLSDATSADDATVVGTGGTIPSTDPIATTHDYFVPFAQAKALGLKANDASTLDGTYTFGGGWDYTYDPNNRAVPGKMDYIGLAMHEISHIMGRACLMGVALRPGFPGYYPMDLFHFSGPDTRRLTDGSGRYFSIDNGTTNLKGFNNASASGGDIGGWAFGTNDSFNAFAFFGVENELSPLDLRTMDVIGYDRVVPEPSTLALLGVGAIWLLGYAWRRRRS